MDARASVARAALDASAACRPTTSIRPRTSALLRPAASRSAARSIAWAGPSAVSSARTTGELLPLM
jgi:hypothetical protein